jgi:predicted enzyme related to lactoylglutathione lyase
MAHAISWFEIPVSDPDRARKFYSAVFGGAFEELEAGPGFRMIAFPGGQGDVGGALMHGEGYEPSMSGSLVYLNGGDDLAGPLGRVEAAGGTILLPKKDIGSGFGFFALIMDTEGNKVGLYSTG